MGDQYSTGVFDLTLDEDIYLLRTYGHCSTVACSTLRCPRCDYTNPLICSGALRPATGNASDADCGGCRNISLPAPLVCQDTSLWPYPSISPMVGETRTFDIPKSGVVFTYHPIPPDACSTFVVKVTPLYGGSTGSLMWNADTWTGNNAQDYLARWTYNSICPDRSGWGKTLVLFFVPEENVPSARARVDIEWIPLPYNDTNKYPSTCTLPAGLTSDTHQCLPEAVERTFTPTVVGQVYRFAITTSTTRTTPLCPGVLYVGSNTFRTLVSTTDPWVSSLNSSTALRRPNFDTESSIPGTFGVCLPAGSTVYVWLYAPTITAFTILVDTNREWIIKDNTNEYSPINYFRNLVATVSLKCGENRYTPYGRYYSSIEDMDTGTAFIRFMYPSARADVFYPQPIFASPPWFAVNIPTHTDDIPATFIPKKLLLQVTLNQRLAPRTGVLGKQLAFPYDYEFMTEQEFRTCSLEFNGLLTGPSDTSVPLTATRTASQIGPMEFTCNAREFDRISAKIRSIQNEVDVLVNQDSVNLDEVNQLYFEQGTLVNSNEFYFCENELLGYSVLAPNPEPKESETDICLFDFGTPAFANDSCCTFNPSAPYATCEPELRAVPDQYVIDSFEPKIATCPTSVCAQDSLTAVIIEKNSLQDPNRCGGSGSFEAETTDLRSYWECLTSVFGEDPIVNPGPTCTHDDDCGAGILCSTRTKRCLVPIALAEQRFITCIYLRLTQFTRNYITQTVLNVTNTSVPILTSWREQFSDPFACSDPYSPVGYAPTALVTGRCPSCVTAYGVPFNLNIVFQYGVGANVIAGGWDCWNGPAECVYTYLPTTADSFCGTQGCTTNTFLPFNLFGAGLCAGGSFCGLCEDGFNCVNVSDVVPLAACNGTGFLCNLANGSKIMTATQAECTSIFSCTVPCPNGPCLTAAECAAAGSCSDFTDYSIEIFNGDTNGGCFFDLRYAAPFDTTALRCGSFRQTILGCVNYAVDEANCNSLNFSYGDRSVNLISNVIYRHPANTSSACAAYGKYCADEVLSSGSNSYSAIYNLNPPSNCKDLRSLFTWTNGTWRGGQPRTVNVTTPQYANRFSQTDRVGLNLPRVLEAVTESVNKIKSLKVESLMFCETHYISFLDELSCSCLQGKPEAQCFANRGNVSNVGVACDEPTTIRTSSALITTTSDSLPAATCISMFISQPTVTIYRDSSISSLRTLLVNYREDTPWAIRNTNDAIVAKVLTDGFVATFRGTVTDVTFCIRLSELRTNYRDASGYPILDLASRPDTADFTDLKPTNFRNVNVTDDGYFCVDLEVLESGTIYHFVQTFDGWEDAPRVVFTGGEIAYLSVLLGLYFLGLLMSSAKLIYLIVMNGFTQIRLVVVLLLMICFFIFRVVLFCLLLSNSLLGTDAARAVSYLLFEFPILLYFCFVSNYISIWLVTISFSRKFTAQQKRNIKIANLASILFNVAILLLFIIMIILFQTVVAEPTPICAGRVIQFDDSQAFALIIAYRSIFSAIAIFIGCMLFVTALMFGELLADPYFEIPPIVRFRIYAISIIGGLGLIAQAIYFLVITATKTTPSNYLSLSILLVVEVIPAMLFIFVETIKTNTDLRTRITGGTKTTQLGTTTTGADTHPTTTTIN